MTTIVGWIEAAIYSEHGRKNGKTVVFTNGVFDVLHVGHIRTLKLARKQGHVLIVGVNTDESVRALKGPYRPINPLAARLEMLEALGFIDYLVPFGTAEDPSVAPLIAGVQPDVLVKGGDYAPDGVVGAALVERRGGRTVIAPKAEGVSTTEVIDRIQKSSTAEDAEGAENHPSCLIRHQLQPWVFVDLDGVLVDFFGSMARALGRDWDPDQCRGEYDPGKIFGCRTDLFSVFGPDFWETADWMPDGRDILAAVLEVVPRERVFICSSPTHETASPMGKLRWIERNMPGWARHYILTPFKQALVSPGAIILDDHDEQISACVKEIVKRRVDDSHPILVPRPWNSLWRKAQGLDVAIWIGDELQAIVADLKERYGQ